MEIQIKLEKDDWIKYQSYIKRKTCQKVIPLLSSFWFNLFLGMVFGLVSIIIFNTSSKLHLPSVAFTAVLFIFVGSLYLWNLFALKKAYLPSETGIFIGEHKYIFDKDGIKAEGVGYQSQISWSIVKKIVRSDGMVLIFLDTVEAIVFPEKKLQPPDVFYTYIKQFVVASR